MKQSTLSSGNLTQPFPDHLLDYLPSFFNQDESVGLLDALKSTIKWKQETFSIFGKTIDVPRLSAWYGDDGKAYSYSGKTYHPHPWNDVLMTIRDRVNAAAGVDFNSVLLNWYRHGNDSMGWHADDEPELGQNPVIASISFGQSRRFDIRLKADHKVKHSIMLENGSLLLMKGDMQQHWQHQIPKSARATGERINLTFRVIS